MTVLLCSRLSTTHVGNYEVYQPEASPMGAQLMGAGMGQVPTRASNILYV